MYKVVLLLFPLLAQAEGNMPPDNWGGRNAHLQYETAIGLVTAEVLPPVWAWSACFSVGVWKEWKDYHKETPGYKHGLFSRNDLKADGVGCAVGLAANKSFHWVLTPAKVQVTYSWELK